MYTLINIFSHFIIFLSYLGLAWCALKLACQNRLFNIVQTIFCIVTIFFLAVPYIPIDITILMNNSGFYYPCLDLALLLFIYIKVLEGRHYFFYIVLVVSSNFFINVLSTNDVSISFILFNLGLLIDSQLRRLNNTLISSLIIAVVFSVMNPQYLLSSGYFFKIMALGILASIFLLKNYKQMDK